MGNDGYQDILEEMKRDLERRNEKRAIITPEKFKKNLPAKTDTRDIKTVPEDELPPWMKEESQTPVAKVIPLMPVRPELVYLPMLLQPSWIPPKGSPEKYIRKFRDLTIISKGGDTPSGQQIGLPSGLVARRILLALVTQAVLEKSRIINVQSISDLMRWANMKMSGRSHRATQKNLLQMAMMNTDFWFHPPETNKAQIYKGRIFNELQVEIEQDSQLQFDFIPREVKFAPEFFEAVIKNKSMPYQSEIVLKASSPIEHDLILWLLHRQAQKDMNGPKHINYDLLYHQFGRAGQDKRKFRAWFKRSVRAVVKKFERDVEVEKTGLVLHPMKHHVPMKPPRW